jgi:hypothetical protein
MTKDEYGYTFTCKRCDGLYKTNEQHNCDGILFGVD